MVLGVPAASFQRHLGSGHGDEPFLHIICAVYTFPSEVRSKPATSSLWLVKNGFPSSRTVIIPNILDSRNLYKKIKEKTKTGLLSSHCSSESVLKLLMANYSMISVDVYASPSPNRSPHPSPVVVQVLLEPCHLQPVAAELPISPTKLGS